MPVPVRWPGGTILCLASGPSLTREDVEYARSRVDGVVAVNNCIFMAPWADVLYASDTRWWTWHHDKLDAMTRWRYTLQKTAADFATVLRNAGPEGLEPKPDGLKHGYQSGYAAINLAAHLGGTGSRVVMLGYDLRVDAEGRHHWHPDHKNGTHVDYNKGLRVMPTILEPLQRLGVAIVNCSPGTAIRGIPRMPLRDVLP